MSLVFLHLAAIKIEKAEVNVQLQDLFMKTHVIVSSSSFECCMIMLCAYGHALMLVVSDFSLACASAFCRSRKTRVGLVKKPSRIFEYLILSL
jgi:hypothetical protein